MKELELFKNWQLDRSDPPMALVNALYETAREVLVDDKTTELLKTLLMTTKRQENQNKQLNVNRDKLKLVHLSLTISLSSLPLSLDN